MTSFLEEKSKVCDHSHNCKCFKDYNFVCGKIMDDLEEEQLCKLSGKPNDREESKFLDRTNTTAKLRDVREVSKSANMSYTMNVEGSNSNQVEVLSVASNNVAIANDNCNAALDDDSDGKEKADATPENLKKIDDVMPGKCMNVTNVHISPTELVKELKIVEDESPSKQSLAFTIDFCEGEQAASGFSATKYKNRVERFYHRHNRGASLSKIEDQSASTTPLSSRASRWGSSPNSKHPESEANKVKMRIRERSSSGVRESNKRHSWSPRSSTHEVGESQKSEKKEVKPLQITEDKCMPLQENFSPVVIPVKSFGKLKDDLNNTTSFTPRSTAMQIALNKIEFACPQPPLDDFSKQKKLDDHESVSEAGTYTVDGDNYTEEQKELMNIDTSKSLLANETTNDSSQLRPTNLPLLSSTINSRRSNNILEISYYHDSTNLKPKISYLDKIKSRVKNITKSPDKNMMTPTDLGTFTSVTTSGVLSKKTTLDTNPKHNRKNSLTKSFIDSSEYISGDGFIKSIGPSYPSTFTDHQKAEYQLNVFSNRIDSHKQTITRNDYECSSPLTPDSPEFSSADLSETGLKTAQSKNDWIQEWARNARARSATSKTNDQMSRSFNFDNNDSVLNEIVDYRKKSIRRYRNHAMGDYEYSSDTNVSGQKNIQNNSNMQNYNEYSNGSTIIARPPLSPSKIPSPVHTVGRTRTASHTRGSLQDLSPINNYTPETDVYLQKTAAAISNLAQSLSRKNSLQNSKSPSSNNNSPRRMHQPHHYSADEYSPTHNDLDLHNTGGNHKRHFSLDYRNNLMSHSLNSETLDRLLDTRNNRRERQNSFDATNCSPRRMYQQPKINNIDQTYLSTKHQQQEPSPIRRSSSFTTKPLSTSLAGQQTVIAKRNIQMCKPATRKTAIQKSASSASFRKMYSDYDDNVEYYINDEDDLVNDYCSSDEYDEPAESYPEPGPLTNTRYNKALLMRIERSKQKVSRTVPNTQNKTGGVVACPNTPEMPRRAAQNIGRASVRQSVPRDSSLNRLRGEVPTSLALAKKQLLQTASNAKKVQPKYMDISKYKSNQGGNFLRKDETKSTLVARSEIKRSPSSASVVLNRNDQVRASNRSIKSAGGRPSNNPAAFKRDTLLPKQKETELAMWKRRATYDPMKAAAEGRRKQEEAKKMAQAMPKASDSSVLRSQSFHSGVGAIPDSCNSQRCGNINNTNDENRSYRWSMISTESSDECEEFIGENS